MRAKDEAEFSEFVAGTAARLQRLAYAVCGDRALAEDAVQSTLVTAYRKWPQVRDASSPEAYVRKMVVNQLMSWRRRKSWNTVSAPSGVTEPSRASHEHELVEHQRVWSAVGDLPPRQRAVIVLRYYEGMSEAQIAAALRIRPGTVKSQSAAAMSHLRAALADTEANIPVFRDPTGAR